MPFSGLSSNEILMDLRVIEVCISVIKGVNTEVGLIYPKGFALGAAKGTATFSKSASVSE